MIVVRPATPPDTAAIAQIYKHHVLNGTGTFEEVPPSVQDMARRMGEVYSRGLPWLVAERGGTVIGFAYAAPFRLRAAYRYTAEDSVYIAHDAMGQGVGKALLSAVVSACEALGLRQLMGVVGDSENLASIALHRALGFELTGTSQGIGFKHGRFIDVVFMQKALNGGMESMPDGGGLTL